MAIKAHGYAIDARRAKRLAQTSHAVRRRENLSQGIGLSELSWNFSADMRDAQSPLDNRQRVAMPDLDLIKQAKQVRSTRA